MARRSIANSQSVTEPAAVRVPEAARLLRVSPNTIWSLLRDGVLPRIRLGRSTLIRISDIHSLLDQLSKEGDTR